MVFNKIDSYQYIPKAEDDLSPIRRENYSLGDLKNTWMGQGSDAVFISALRKENMDEFRDMVYQKVKGIHIGRYPYDNLLF
jgi:GTP-binding protein HflX